MLVPWDQYKGQILRVLEQTGFRNSPVSGTHAGKLDAGGDK